ncbi:MAG: trypsin-like peptidase domain-containing protein [Thermoleophilia bacterium]
MNSQLPPIPPRPEQQTGLPPIPGKPVHEGGLPPLNAREPRGWSAPRPRPAPPSATRPRRGLPPLPGRGAAVVAAVLVAGLVGGIAGAQIGGGDSSPPPAPSPTPTTGVSTPAGQLASAVAAAAPSVVQVRTPSGQGSGVVLADRGLIVTNHHVIAGSERVAVITADDRQVSAVVVQDDPEQDLAILEPSGPTGPGALIASEANGGLRVGDQVFAIGSPFGLQNTVTSGIVSYVDRPGEGGVPMIQTDAPINPGNSGGGLFDLRGRLVGIPTAIRAPISGNVGIGFAVPASRVTQLLERVP